MATASAPAGSLNKIGVINASHDLDVAALFLPGRGEILLKSDLDLDGHGARGYLAHELVHAQQLSSGTASGVSCLGRPEYEAYSVQARYLQQHGLRQDAFRVMAGLLQESCQPDH